MADKLVTMRVYETDRATLRALLKEQRRRAQEGSLQSTPCKTTADLLRAILRRSDYTPPLG